MKYSYKKKIKYFSLIAFFSILFAAIYANSFEIRNIAKGFSIIIEITFLEDY